MSYHVLAYGSDILPNIDRCEQTVALMDLWKYPWVVVLSTRDIDWLMAHAAVPFRHTEWMH